MLHSFSSTYRQNMSPYSHRVYCPNSDFSFSVFVWTSMALQITVLIVKSGHIELYFTHKEKRMSVAYSFYCKIHAVFRNQKKIDFQIFVIHLNGQNLKTLLLQIFKNQNKFFKKIWCYTFFLLYLWEKYELIRTAFTSKTVTLGANLLVKAQTIPQNANCEFFFTKSCVY